MPVSHDIHRILTLKCRGAARIISDAIDQRASRVDRLAAWGHLVTCASCRRYRRHLHYLRRLLHAAADEIEAEATAETDGRLANIRLTDEMKERLTDVLDDRP